MINSRIPVKKTSRIPVRVEANKDSENKNIETRKKLVPPEVKTRPKKYSKSSLDTDNLKPNKFSKTLSKQNSKSCLENDKLKQNKFSKTLNKENSLDNDKLKQNKFSKTLGKSCNVVPLIKTKIQAEECPAKANFLVHPSQTEIEFVPDEMSRKRILGCIDIPSAPSASNRGQSSIYNRPSIYNVTPIVKHADPCKAMLKNLERLRKRDGRESIQSLNFRDSLNTNRFSLYNSGSKPSQFQNGILQTLQNINRGDRTSISNSAAQFSNGNNCFTLARKTPKMVFAEAKKRIEEQKLKESKSVKKVTFQLVVNTASGKENKFMSESSPFEARKDNKLCESSTPRLELERVSKESELKRELDKTPTFSDKAKILLRESPAPCNPNSNVVKQPVSILENNLRMEDRRGSLFSSMLTRNKPGKMRRSVSFSDIPLVTRHSPAQKLAYKDLNTNQREKLCPSGNLESSPQQLSPACFSPMRKSISSPDLPVICRNSAPRIEKKVNHNTIFTPSTKSTLALLNTQTNELMNRLRSPTHMAEPRSSLYLLSNQREVPPCKKPILCTPVPVSFYPSSKTLESFSPEFLCPRTSNYIADPPIKTPLVMRHLAEIEKTHDLNQVKQKLTFLPSEVENNKPKCLIQVKQKNMLDCMTDQECKFILCEAEFPYVCNRDILNPIAKTLEKGDEMHFVPASPYS